MASITILCDGVEEKHPLEAASVTLGRGLESDVRLKDIKASRRHCQIVKTPQGYQVQDLSSGNGTYVNGIQVKQQALSPGDKIQIGSTTITFVEAASGAKPASAAAAAKAGGPPSTGRAAGAVKTATATVPAAHLPTAPTKKITAHVPVVKPTTQALSKQPTQPLPKSGTASIKKTTGRTGHTTRSTPMSNTEKFRAEARKKKSNPVMMLMVGIGVIFLAVLGFILFSPSGDSGEQFKEALVKLRNEASAADIAGRYDEAISKYKQILAKIEGSDKYKTQVVDVKGSILELQQRKGLMATADKRFSDLKTRYQTVKDEDVVELQREVKLLLSDAKDTEFPWKNELKEISAKLEKIDDTNKEIRKRLEFQNRRNEIIAKHKLGSSVATEPQFGPAMADWQAYLGEKGVSDESKQKAQNEMNNLNIKAKGAVATLKSRANRMVEENKKAEAIDECKRQRTRFKETAASEDLEAIIQQLEK